MQNTYDVKCHRRALDLFIFYLVQFYGFIINTIINSVILDSCDIEKVITVHCHLLVQPYSDYIIKYESILFINYHFKVESFLLISLLSFCSDCF